MALIGSPVLNNFRRSRRRAAWFKRSEKMNSVQVEVTPLRRFEDFATDVKKRLA